MRRLVLEIIDKMVIPPLIGLIIGSWVTLVMRTLIALTALIAGIESPSWLMPLSAAVGCGAGVFVWFGAWRAAANEGVK